MKLSINIHSLAEDVKKDFTVCYPFLKIELYKKQLPDTAYKNQPIPLNRALIQQTQKEGKTEINIDENTTVAGLENQFKEIGLMAEIFRKSGNVWVETLLTSNWTLQQQNAEGEEISRHF